MSTRKILCLAGLTILLGAASLQAQSAISYAVTWNPIADPSVSEVLIYRAAAATDAEPIITDYALIAAVGVSASVYDDVAGLQTGVRYYYRLRSRNYVGSTSGFSDAVSALTILCGDPAWLADQCAVNSVTKTGESTWTVQWSTLYPAVGSLEYWKMGVESVVETAEETVYATEHSMEISGLDEGSIYFIRAVSHGEQRKDVTISGDFSFLTSGTVEQIIFVLEPSSLEVPEGGTAGFTVRLSSIPSEDLAVSVSRAGGDSDIEVESGASLVFTAGDWYIPKAVTLSAAEDLDQECGEASILVTRVSGPDAADASLAAVEIDNETDDDGHGDLASAGVAIYPIPFKPADGALTIGNLPESGRIGIYDLKGQKVWDESWESSTTLSWNGENNAGVGVASGRYFVVITTAGGSVAEKRVILVVN